MRPTARHRILATAVYIILVMVAVPEAQAPAVLQVAERTGKLAGSPVSGQIHLLVGRSAVLNLEMPVSRVSLTTPEIADVLVTTPQQLLIHGKAPGAISLFVWETAGRVRTFEVVVERDLSALAERLSQLFPGEAIQVASNGKDVVLSGTVSSRYVVEKAADVAAGYVEKKENVVNLLRQREGVASNQVLLRVRFAEVSRSALQELGAAYFTSLRGRDNWVGRATTQQFPAPEFDAERGSLVFSDFLNLFVFNLKEDLGTLIRALQTRGLFQSLAEPNLIATNGKEASFLAGGEYPYPVVQATAAGTAITIQFKEFGVRLSFTPTLLGGDLISLKVRPEVSSLDFTNAVVIQGFRIPALSTRRTETEIELRDGQTFAIAGLLNNTATSSMAKIPGIGDIPILGLLFRSRAYQKNETELVVLITPQIVQTGSMGAATGLPSLVEPFLGPPSRRLPPPPPYGGAPKYPVPPGRSGNASEDQGAVPAAPAGGPRATPSAADSGRAPAGPSSLSGSEGGAGAGRGAAPAASPPPVSRPSDSGSAAALVPTVPEPAQQPEPPGVAASARPLTKHEREAIARARRDFERQQKEEAKRRAAEARRAREQARREAKDARELAEKMRRQVEAERKRAEKAAREEAKRAVDAQARAAKQAREDAKRRAEAEKAARRRAEAERKRAEKLAREEAKRRAAEEARAAKEAERRAKEDAAARRRAAAAAQKRQAEEKERALAEAERRLREAEAAYRAELERLKRKGGS